MRRFVLTCALALAWAPSASAAIRLATVPAAVTNQTSATFAFTSDSAVAPAGFACTLDGADDPCLSPQTYDGLAAGEHTFSVRTTGSIVSASATYDWRIDIRAPRTAIVARPPAVTSSHTATFGFQSDEDPGQIECRLDGSTWLPCPASLRIPRVSQGNHTLQARAVDAAGNRDRTPSVADWTVDAAAPAVLIESIVRGRRPTGGTAGEPYARLVNPAGGRTIVLPRSGLLVRGEATDASRVAGVEIALQRSGACRFFDGRRAARLRPCSAPRWLPARLSGAQWSYRLASGAKIPAGTYHLLVRALDAAGNSASGFSLRRSATPRATFRLLTFNVAGGPTTQTSFDPASVASLVSSSHPDVIGLEEVCSWAAERLVALLGGEGYLYYAHLPAITDLPDPRSGSPGSCDYGDAVISKLPLSRPSTRTASYLVAPPRCGSYSSQGVFPECRVADSVDLVPPGYDRPVRVTAVQLGPDRDPLQDREAAALDKLAAAGPERAIVMGDLNMSPDDTRLDGLRDAGYRSVGGSVTFPFTSFETPYLQIDGIFVRGRFRSQTHAINPEVCGGSGCESISDHRALFSTITLE
jgi:endonuclease/exonuclease/phosphatase family metal-dependent hydrolase